MKKLRYFPLVFALVALVGCTTQSTDDQTQADTTTGATAQVEVATDTVPTTLIAEDVVLEWEEALCHILVTYPQFTAEEEWSGLEVINQAIADTANQQFEALQQEEYQETTTVELEYIVARNDGQWLSIRYEGYSYIEGPSYPTASVDSQTFLLSDPSHEVTLADFFCQADYVDTLIQGIENTDDYKAYGDYITLQQLEEAMGECTPYLTEDELVIVFNEGILGPHALGMPQFYVQLDSLGDVLAENLI